LLCGNLFLSAQSVSCKKICDETQVKYDEGKEYEAIMELFFISKQPYFIPSDYVHLLYNLLLFTENNNVYNDIREYAEFRLFHLLKEFPSAEEEFIKYYG